MTAIKYSYSKQQLTQERFLKVKHMGTPKTHCFPQQIISTESLLSLTGKGAPLLFTFLPLSIPYLVRLKQKKFAVDE